MLSAMVHTWGVPGEQVRWTFAKDSVIGTLRDLVMDLVCQSCDGVHSVVTLHPCGTQVRVLSALPELPSGTSFSVLKARFHGMVDGLLQFDLQGCRIMIHKPLSTSCLWRVVETCCGVGCMTSGLAYVGFRCFASNDWNHELGKLYMQSHPFTEFILGDISDDDTLIEIHATAPDAACLCAGFSCQPYSKGGPQQGALDSRAKCLFDVLRAAVLLRKPLVCLECVSEASSNQWVRNVLLGFAKECKYHMSEVQLQLDKVWPCRRKRWWVVLSALPLGRVQLRDFPEVPHPLRVRDVLPEPLQLSLEELSELQLTPHEYARMLQFGQPSTMILDFDGVCPTFVHSCGSQVLECPCGCRLPFTNDTLSRKGVFGVLLPCSGTITVNGEIHPALRHPHPVEVAILTGCQLPVLKPHSLRLWLSGLGQQATPFQSMWIAVQIRSHIERYIGGFENCDPQQVLLDFTLDVQDMAAHCLQIRQGSDLSTSLTLRPKSSVVVAQQVPELVPEVPAAFDMRPAVDSDVVATEAVSLESTLPGHFTQTLVAHLDMQDDPPVPPLALIAPTQDALMTSEVEEIPWPCPVPLKHLGLGNTFTLWDQDGSSHQVIPLAHTDVTVAHLLAAEKSLGFNIDEVVLVDCYTTLEASPSTPLVGKAFQLQFPSVCQRVASAVPCETVGAPVEPVSPTLPFTVKDGRLCDPLLALSSLQLMSLLPPVVSSMGHLRSLLATQLSSDARLQVLDTQADVMADDELRFHLKFALERSDIDGLYLDPLLCHAIASGNHIVLQGWVSALPKAPALIVSALWTSGHWIPVVVHFRQSVCVVETWSVDADSAGLHAFAHLLKQAFRCVSYQLVGGGYPCVTAGFCGILAVAFVERALHLDLWPVSVDAVHQAHEDARQLFCQSVLYMPTVSRPWLWGNGLEASGHTRLAELLLQHGVTTSQVNQRIALAVQAIGALPLQRALLSAQPWRNLKSVANQCRPVFQWILPEELSAAVEKKQSQTKPKKAAKTQQIHAKAPAKITAPALDPAKLEFEAGAFVNGQGAPLAQLQPTQLGPLAEGIVLATVAMVDRFVAATTVVTSKALAVFLLDLPCLSDVQLPCQELRIAVRCKANQEPVLLSGHLLQLGSDFVVRAPQKLLDDFQCAQVSTTKLTVYRDCLRIDWAADFCKSPIRYIMQHLPFLETCSKPEGQCDCDRWHRAKDSPTDTSVVDMWRKQWLNPSFRPVQAQASEVFAVNVRHISEFTARLLQLSGQNAIFSEPRSIDARQPDADYQIIWMPRHSLTDVQHLAQCNPEISGIARMGSRYGIRGGNGLEQDPT